MKSQENSSGPLAGIRILDLTAVVLGPLATQILGDYGAEVIKVEGLEGDLMRPARPYLTPGLGATFLSVNRNKRSLAINLKTPEGSAAVLGLVPKVDVFIHNMRVPAIEKLGFGYERVSELNPSIVYCAATGFGQGGPHRDRPAFDDIIQAASGLVALNSEGGGQPAYTPTLIADKTVGLALVNAVLAALLHRARTGEGQYVEVPMLETMVSFMLAEHLGGLTFDPPVGNAGYQRILAGGRRPSPTADGFVSILPYTPAQWTGFFVGSGREDLAKRFRVDDRDELNGNLPGMYAELVAITPTRTTEEWMRFCDERDIPATPIYSIDKLPEHPHLVAVGLFKSAVHPVVGPIRYVEPPTLFSATPATVRRHAPALGEHTMEILREAGLDEPAIQSLLDSGVARAYVPAGTEASWPVAFPACLVNQGQ